MRRKNIIEFQNAGGSWLGSVRNWIQCSCLNGERVTWGSNDILKLNRNWTVKVLEEIALRVAFVVYNECESKKPHTYTDMEMMSFAVYRAQYSDETKDDYKNIMDCLYDWKKEQEPVEH